jgi:eukaryotic-like serine/threonine-protein kinase
MTESEIFKAVLAIPPAERDNYLNRVCGANRRLRDDVVSLLRAHDASNGPLQKVDDGQPRTGAYEPLVEGPGTRVGPYKLLQEIGEGGMGTVFMAEQEEPIRRMVAVKIIRSGMDSKGVLARFEAERQALALMDHPNIAKVLDAGTTASGSPYFVMELVKGVPITKFCDENQLSFRERLELFVPVCQAIQHAHMKGIIHRDIKPSNVLVAMYDDQPVPKVIDFGVAKATSQKLTDKTLFTAYGAVVGTLEYMSPEQAKLNQLDIDTRSDVYALGVLLYELLTGSTPLDRTRLKSAALDEVLRLIREEEPQRPSTRLSTAATLPQLAAARRSPPAQLGKVLQGELDWIVMRCLEKDRTRRYESATGLAKDVERYLSGEAVEACPPTLGYRLKKAYRRNRAAMLVTSAFVILLTCGAVIASVLAVQATRAEQLARLNAEEARTAQVQAVEQRDEAVRLSGELRQASYVTNISLAAASLEIGQVGRTRGLLERTRPASTQVDQRGFEWHYLRREIQREKATFAAGRGAKIATSPNGRYLAATHEHKNPRKEAGEFKLWDLHENREIFQANVDCSFASTVVFSPDGKLVATSRYDSVTIESERTFRSEITIREVPSGRLCCSRKFADQICVPEAFSPDGRTLACVPSQSPKPARVTTYSASGFEEVFTDPVEGVRSAAFTASGELIIVYAKGESLYLKHPKRPKDVLMLDGQAEAVSMAFTNTEFTAGGAHLLAVSLDRMVRVWDIRAETPKTIGQFQLDSYDATSYVSLSPSGTSLALSTRLSDGRPLATVWDVRTGQKTHTLRGHIRKVYGIAFAADNRTVATSSEDGTIKLWDAPPQVKRDRIESAVETTVASLKFATLAYCAGRGFSALSKRSIIADTGGITIECLLRDESTSHIHFRSSHLLNPKKSPRMDLAPDGSRVAAVGWEKRDRILVWDTNGEKLANLPPDGVPGIAAWFGSKDRLIVLEPGFAAFQVWDLVIGKPVARVPGALTVLDHACMSPDGRLLVTSSPKHQPDYKVVVRDISSGDVLHTLTGHSDWAGIFAFNREGTHLATGDRNGLVIVWDVKTGQAIQKLTGHAGTVNALAFSPDGRRLFSGGADSTVRVWDTTSGNELLVLRHDDRVVSLAISDDGHRLATQVDRGAAVRIFDGTPFPDPKQ